MDIPGGRRGKWVEGGGPVGGRRGAWGSALNISTIKKVNIYTTIGRRRERGNGVGRVRRAVGRGTSNV